MEREGTSQIDSKEKVDRTRTILVTGGAGFIGSNFIHYWLENHPKDRIVNFDLLTYAGNLENLRGVEKAHEAYYTFVQGNIANQELVDHVMKIHKPDIVVNFAAESHNSRAVSNPGIFFETNVLGTQKLLDVVTKNGVERFHHISTCEVYGDLDLDSGEKFTESSLYRPRTPYNASKAGADMAVRAYYETFGLPVTISISSNNYGPYQFPEKLIPRFITSALGGIEMTLYQHSHNRREWLHVQDHCRAIDLILHSDKVGESYNVGSGEEADIETVADTIIKELGLDSSYKTYVEDRPGHDRRYLLDSSKIGTQLGWEPTINFDQGIKETIKWYVRNQDWWDPLLVKLAIAENGW